jgi:protein gp37
MSAATKIEWTRSDDGSAGATWNPVTGCTTVTEGCDHCYTETLVTRAGRDLFKNHRSPGQSYFRAEHGKPTRGIVLTLANFA